MTDGLGSVTYTRNQLSQLTAESRTFTGLGTFTLNYAYNLAGQLTSITDPFGAQVGYTYDNAGRLNAITGANFASVSTYASALQYRAWGALKSLNYGNSKTLALSYDARLNVSTYEVPSVLKKSYQYYDDGRLKFTQDQLITNSKFDRLYKHDHLGRITSALSGAEARGQGTTNDRPYNETMTYDALGHLASREVRQWDHYDNSGVETYVNNRRQGWQYDADGRLTSGSSGYRYFDAAGELYSFGDWDPYKTDQQLDGDGRRAKSILQSYDPNTSQWTTEKVTYYVSSTVLGAVISEVSAQGAKERSFVHVGGDVMAIQSVQGGGQYVGWEHYDASGSSYRPTNSSGNLGWGAELDPVGADAGIIKPLTWPQSSSAGKLAPYYGVPDLNSATQGCVLDGIPTPCGIALGMAMSGTADITYIDPILASTGRSRAVWVTQDTSYGTSDLENNFVTIYSGPGGVFVWVEDLNSGLETFVQSQPQSPQNPNTDDLIARATKIMQAKGCAEYLQNLMSKANEMTRRSPNDSSIRNILKTVGEQGKVIYGDTIKKYYGWEGATTQGSIQSGNAQIELPYPTPFQSFQPKAVHDRMAAAFAEQRAWSDAQTLIHESFHLAGYSDRELMEAAAAIAKVGPPDFSNLTPNNRIRQQSLWWTFRLQAACPPVR